ncbi:MAG: spore germination protein GerW family protein [Gemmatimonadota bacterium]|jgi:uncharacterized spore protein YtfJ
MTEEHDHVVETMDSAHEGAAEILAELVAVASAANVFSEPVVAGDTTIITAAEIHTGMGFGYGLAAGNGSRGEQATESHAKARIASWGWGRRDRCDGGPRGGGGGGGGATGRPVAVVTIDPAGVHVKPVLDRTRIVLTALTALGAIGLTLIRLRRAAKH